jgi:hypothetical protein
VPATTEEWHTTNNQQTEINGGKLQFNSSEYYTTDSTKLGYFLVLSLDILLS